MARRSARCLAAGILVLILVAGGLFAQGLAGAARAQGCGGTSPQPGTVAPPPAERWRLAVAKAGSLDPILITDRAVVVAAYGRGCALSVLSLRGLDPETGKELWRGTGTPSGAMVDRPVGIGDAVYLPGFRVKQGSATTAWLRVLDAATGAVRWQLADDPQNPTSVSGGDGRLTLLARGSNEGSAVLGVDATTGTTRWTARLARLVQRASLDPDSRLVYAVEGNAVEANDVVALDAATGTEIWRVAAPGGAEASILAATSAGVIVQGGAQVALLAVADGTASWTVDTGATGPVGVATAAVLIKDALITITGGGGTARVVAVALADGATRWTADVPGGVAGRNPPVVAGNRLIVGTSSGATGGTLTGLVALDLADGRQAWTAAVPGLVNILSGTDAIYLTDGAQVRALAAATGDERWHLDLSGLGSLRLLTLAGGTLFVNAEHNDGAVLVALAV